jgi:glycosyltransferase involved in cell wall biosynthesis
LTKLACHAIVLTPKGKNVLETQYKVHNVSYIPYGVHKSRIFDHEYAKQKLGLSNKVVLFCFGYPYPNKGFQYAIEAVGKLVEMGYDNTILLLQDTRPAHDYRKCEEYVNMLKDLVRRKNLERYVHFIPFISEVELPLYLSATDIFIYPFEPRVASSSSLMRTIYFGKPHILSDIPAFEFIKNLRLKNIIFVKPKSLDGIAKAILEIFSRYEKYEEDTYYREWLDSIDWGNIGKMHIKLYYDIIVKCR